MSFSAKYLGKVLATLLIAGLLMLTLISDAFQPTQPAYTGQAWLPPAPQPVNMRLLRKDVRAFLLTDLTGAAPDQAPSMIHLLILPGQGTPQLLTLPTMTRTLVDRMDAQGQIASASYATLSEAYTLGAIHNQGFENLMRAVSRMLGGIPIEKCVALEANAMALLADQLGGIPVRIQYMGLSASLLGGSGNIQGQGVLLGSQIYDYARSSLEGRYVDSAALSRQQELVLGYLERIKLHGVTETAQYLRDNTRPWLWSTLTQEDLSALDNVLARYDPLNMPATLLWGEDRIIDGIGYRLPDSIQVKTFVLDTFYE